MVSHLNDLQVDFAGAEKTSVRMPDGSQKDFYVVEGDIHIPLKEFQKLTENSNLFKQYSSHNLLREEFIFRDRGSANSRAIRIVGLTGGTFGLTANQRSALTAAVANYNEVDNFRLQFQLSFATDQNVPNTDIIVYRNPFDFRNGAGAGFPSTNGSPHDWVQLYSGLDNSNLPVLEHVITHELGHCIGFRHTDWDTRVSCSNPTPEQRNPTGANHIVGTPTGTDWNSVMLACFTPFETGEFGSFDIVALQRLYGPTAFRPRVIRPGATSTPCNPNDPRCN